MKPWKGLFAAGLLLAPALVLARGETITITRCYASHFVRFNPSINLNQLRNTVVFLNNGDLENPAVIERLTVRSASGTVLHDSGPKVGVPHPLNPGLPPPGDFTTVPPGATYAVATLNLWGNGDVPVPPGLVPMQVAGTLSVTVEVAKAGNPKLFVVHARENARERVATGNPIQPFTQGAEHAANETRCFRVGDGDE